MTINVMKTSGDGCNVIPISQKMILYSLYESAEKTIADKSKVILMLDQKVIYWTNVITVNINYFNIFNFVHKGDTFGKYVKIKK